MTGTTQGTFPGQTSAGLDDAFVCQYDTDGNQSWCRQFGTPDWDGAMGIASHAGGIYVAGYTGGTFPGQSSAGNGDAFVCQYDSDGNQAWCLQFGTPDGGDYVTGVTSGPGEMYLAGGTGGTFPGESCSGLEGKCWNETFVAKLGTQTPAQALQELAAFVVSLNFKAGISNSLDAKLQAAVAALDDVNEHNNVAAINNLQAFINAVEAQRGIHISEADADALIVKAQAIIAMLVP